MKSWNKYNDNASPNLNPSTSSTSSKNMGILTLDRAAFLLIRIKRAFNKRKSKRNISKSSNMIKKTKPPLLRARTLPAIVTPSLNILQAQLKATNYSGKENEERGSEKSSDQKSRFLRQNHHNKPQNFFLNNQQIYKFQLMNENKVFKSSGLSSQNDASFSSSGVSLNQKDKSSWNPSNRPILKKSNSIDNLLGFQLEANRVSNTPDADDLNAFLTKNEIKEQNFLELQKLKSAKKQNSFSPNFSNKISKPKSIDFLFSESLTRTERKRLERLNKFNFDVQALFTAVEHDQLQRAKALIDSTDVDVNSVNSDGFTPLDIALLIGNAEMIKFLQSRGAKEISLEEKMASHIQSLIENAEEALLELNTYLTNVSTSTSISTAATKKKERQKTFWVRRLQYLKKIQNGFNLLEIPDKPLPALLEVVGNTSVQIKFIDSKISDAKKMLTNYKVEWSLNKDFTNLSQLKVYDVQSFEVIIEDLLPDYKYFFRVAAGNLKGYSEFCETSPSFATPSTWRSLCSKEYQSKKSSLGALDKLFQQVIDSRPEHAAEVKVLSEECDTPVHQRKNQMRKSIRHLFTTAPKFQKILKRGVYLACVLFYEDKILVTTEDNLPIVEVDSTYPSASLQSEFSWLLKVTCTWDDVKTLRLEMEKCTSSSTVHFRSKLLQAIELLQASLGIQDLGQLYFEPFQDPEGILVIVSTKKLSDLKLINSLSVKWISLFKFSKRVVINRRSESIEGAMVNISASDMLLSSLKDIIIYNKTSQTSLSRGLYLGYVQMQSSMDSIRILVSKSNPNVFPFAKIKDNPHVSKAEWQSVLDWPLEEHANLFQNLSKFQETDDQTSFKYSILLSIKHLQKMLQIDEAKIFNHRLMDSEIIEFSKDVTFILLLPQVENVCSILGQTNQNYNNSDFHFLPVQIFENIHMRTYQPQFLARYSRILLIVEMDTMVAQQILREAFSSCELNSAKIRLNQLQEFQAQLDDIWRSKRWIMNVINYARDKQLNGGIVLNSLCNQLPHYEDVEMTPPRSSISNIFLSTSQQTLQVKTDNDSNHCNQRRPSNDDSFIGLSTDSNFTNNLRLATSVSTYSLLDVVHNQACSETTDPQIESKEIKKCASASRLVNENNPKIIQTSLTESNQIPFLDEEKLAKVNRSDASFSNSTLNESLFSKKDSAFESLEKKQLSNGDIIRVYPTYESGIPLKTNVKIRIGNETRVRDVLDLVVKQLNAVVKLKSLFSPSYHRNEWSDFELVIFLENNIKIIPDDWKLVDLTEPWFRGKFCVRYKKDYC